MAAPMTDALGVAAATAGVLMAISPLLQIRRMYQTVIPNSVALAVGLAPILVARRFRTARPM